MATRMRIAAAACVLMSGLFVGSAGAALAFADPETGQSGETPGSPADPSGTGTSAPTHGQTPAEGTTTEPSAAVTPTVTAPSPTPQVGDGRNGLASDGPGATRATRSTSKRPSPDQKAAAQTESTGTGEPAPTESPGLAEESTDTIVKTTTETTTETTETTTTTKPPGPPDGNPPPWDGAGPGEHEGWHWPWCWPNPPGQPPGRPPSSGSSGSGGGVSLGTPPIGVGIPKAPPQMQLPTVALPQVVPPTLPVVSVDPVVDVITGLATAAADLPFTPLTLPVIVSPLGAGGAGAGGGAGGAGGPGIGPRPGTPSAPGNSGGPQSRSQPPKDGQQNPAFSASNGAMPASYRAGYGDYLRSAGIGQVAAVAVPGVTGILVLTGAGGLVGFRQARAGHTVRANGTARFIG